MLMLILKYFNLTNLSNKITLYALSWTLNIVKSIIVADYLDCLLQKSYKRFLYLALAFKSLGLISISNIYQNFYVLRSNIEENQNLELIYYRS